MQFDIPEEVTEVFGEIYAQTFFSKTLELLKWITKHPNEARKVASRYKTLNKSEKTTFQVNMFTDADLGKTLNWTMTYSAREHKRRSRTAKFLAELRKGEATFKFGERKGHAVRIQDDIQLKIPTSDTEVVFVGCSQGISSALETLEEGHIPTWNVSHAIYEGNKHRLGSHSGESIVKAAENNLRPEIAALIEKE